MSCAQARSLLLLLELLDLRLQVRPACLGVVFEVACGPRLWIAGPLLRVELTRPVGIYDTFSLLYERQSESELVFFLLQTRVVKSGGCQGVSRQGVSSHL